MLQRLIDLLFEFKEYVLLASLVVVSLALLAFNDNPQVKFLRAVTSVVFGVVEDQLTFIPSYIGLRSENAVLRRLNVELADEAYRLRDAKLENMRLRALLALKERHPARMLGAKVVGKQLTLLRNTLTLDVGSLNGVRERMPVMNENGLVGIVIAVTPSYCSVNILLNTDFRASVKVERSRVDGILAWDGINLVVKNVAKTRDVKPGDVILTSEYSNTFPADIRVGVVSEVRDQPGGLFKNVTVMPSVNVVRLEEVFILDHQPNAERAALEQRVAAGGR
jgi:rod shape-determining protein MreC